MLGGASRRGYGKSGRHSRKQQRGEAGDAAATAEGEAAYPERDSQEGLEASSIGTFASASYTDFGNPSEWRGSIDGSEGGMLSSMGSLDLAGSLMEDLGESLEGFDGWRGEAAGPMVERRCSGSGECDKSSRRVSGHLEEQVEQLQGTCLGQKRQHHQHHHQQQQQQHWEQSSEVLELRHGPVIRVVQPGESVGEIALLKRGATRTATLIAEPVAVISPATAAATGTGAGAADNEQQQQQEESLACGVAAGGEGTGRGWEPSPEGGVCLIRITRVAFDAAVRSLQVAALEGLLGFLGSVPAFAGLSRDQLTSLAVFCRPVKAAAGQVLAGQGEVVEALLVVQASTSYYYYIL